LQLFCDVAAEHSCSAGSLDSGLVSLHSWRSPAPAPEDTHLLAVKLAKPPAPNGSTSQSVWVKRVERHLEEKLFLDSAEAECISGCYVTSVMFVVQIKDVSTYVILTDHTDDFIVTTPSLP